MVNVIYISLQRYKLWLIMIDAYNSVRLMILSIRLMHGFVAYCGIAMPLWQSALLWVIVLKRKIFNRAIIKRVVTLSLTFTLLFRSLSFPMNGACVGVENGEGGEMKRKKWEKMRRNESELEWEKSVLHMQLG